MTESQLTRNVLLMMRKEFPGIWCYKVNDRFTSGVPDILGCLPGGRIFAIELKIWPNEATKIQNYVLDRIREVGGRARVCYDIKQVREFLNEN